MPQHGIYNGNWHLEEAVKTIEMSTEQYHVNVTYPEYFLSERPLSVFNTAISGKVTAYVGDFTDAAVQFTPQYERKSELRGEHSTYTAIKRFITVKVDLYPYLGGAHPDHDIFTVSFDTAAYVMIALSDLFVDGSNYLNRLSTLSEKALFEKYPELGFAFNDPTYRRGFAPEEENFSRWALTDSGFIIFFYEYQVAPYAAGALDIEIPYASVEDIMYSL